MSRFHCAFFATAAALLAISMPLGQFGNAKEPAPYARFVPMAIQSASAPNPADQLPAGEGRDVTVRVCSQCHGVSNFAQKRYNQDRWDSVLDDMVSKGLNASDDDMTTVEKYLTTYLGPKSQDGGSSDSSPAPKNN